MRTRKRLLRTGRVEAATHTARLAGPGILGLAIDLGWLGLAVFLGHDPRIPPAPVVLLTWTFLHPLAGVCLVLATFRRGRHRSTAILANAIDPGSPYLGTYTAPFCYRGGEVATVIATGIVNDAAGNELARHVLRETVAVALGQTALEVALEARGLGLDRGEVVGDARIIGRAVEIAQVPGRTLLGGQQAGRRQLVCPGRRQHSRANRHPVPFGFEAT